MQGCGGVALGAEGTCADKAGQEFTSAAGEAVTSGVRQVQHWPALWIEFVTNPGLQGFGPVAPDGFDHWRPRLLRLSLRGFPRGGKKSEESYWGFPAATPGIIGFTFDVNPICRVAAAAKPGFNSQLLHK